MKVVRHSLTGLGLGIALAVAWFVGGGLFRDVQFAHAQQQVEATRQQIANIQDMAAVYKAVGKAVEPSVVSIDVRKTVRLTDSPRLRRFFPDRDGDGQPDIPQNLPFDIPQQQQEQGTGSGVIMETDGKTGYIVTNNHVAGGASEMVVTLWDGREIKDAKLVGADPKSDIAVVKIEADHLIPAKWGNSDTLEKGDIVMAFGSPFGYVGSMTHGIVSALHRQANIISNQFAYENFIQVDAPINPGNSGGPLVNLKGEVVGINTAIASESGGFQGLGFTIPANQAKFVFEAIKNKGRVVRGWLGVKIGDVSKEPDLAAALGYHQNTGVIVNGIMNKTPATGRLEQGDIITSLNGKKVDDVQSLRNEIAATPPGTDVKLGVIRNGKQQDVTVKLGEQPDEPGAIASAAEEQQKSNGSQTTPESLGLRLSSPNDQLTQQYGLDQGAQGALVTQVLRQNSPAYLAGIRPGDIITKIDDTSIKSADDAREALAKKDPSKGIKIYVTNRDGSQLLFLKTEK